MNAPLRSVSKKEQREARIALWRRGNFLWQLRDYQREIIRSVEASGKRKFFSMCSRRIGKTTMKLLKAHQDARNGFDVRYCYPTLLQAEEVLVPMFEEMFETCPDDVRPKFSAKHLCWEYPNGAVKLGGADTRRAANRLRGKGVNRFYMDEACFFEEFTYVMKDVALPQLFTSNGTMWLSSTPPESPAHPSVAVFEECKAAGAIAHHTLWVTEPYYGRDRIEEFIREAGGEGSTTADREYYAKVVPDAKRAIVPEFSKHEDLIVRESERPKYCFKYTVGDFGFNDLTVVVFAYYDFERAKIVIEDEVVAERESSMTVANLVVAKEDELWGKGAKPQRVADADLQLLADMIAHNGCVFVPPNKTDADAALNAVRMHCSKLQIEINPRCHVTIAHLRNGIWNSARTSYERVDGFGHFDAVDAVKYLVRHVDKGANPFPVLADGVSIATHHIPTTKGRRRGVLAAFAG